MLTNRSFSNDASYATLWDLDGTLVDTNLFHWQAWQDELATHHRTLSWEEFSSTFGQRNDTILRLWISEDLSAADIRAISDSKEARYRNLVHQNGLDLLPGVKRLLEELRSAGWRQALATMTSRVNVNAIFSVLPITEYFDGVATGDDVSLGKPAPDIFLLAAEKIRVLSQACIVVEDSTAGIEAAQRAKMKTVGVNSRITLPADLYVNTLEDVSVTDFTKMMKQVN